jgi:signal transduction histidine kinase
MSAISTYDPRGRRIDPSRSLWPSEWFCVCLRGGTRLRLICAALVVWVAAAVPASSDTRHVVLLYDERVSLPGLSVLDESLVRTLSSDPKHGLEIYREELDFSRFGSDAYLLLIRNYLQAKYANKKIDMVMAIMAPALDFMLAYGDMIFPKIPVVFSGIDTNQLANRRLPSRFTGVLVKREFSPTLEIAIHLHPDTKQVIVVAGTSDFDVQLLEQARSEFGAYEGRFSFTYLTKLPLRELLAQVSHLPSQTIVLYTTLFRDGTGEPFVPHDVAERLSAASNAPVYGFLDQYLEHGLVGGHLYSVAMHGVAAARLGLRVLDGAEPSELPVVAFGASETLFNWGQLKRWGIDESRLPPGSKIRFRPLTAWDQYGWQIIAIFVALLLQAAAISWLLFERHRRKRAELESRGRMLEVIHLNRTAAAGVLSASIAHEINQPLGAILSNAEAAELLLTGNPPDLNQLKEILGDIRHADQRAAEIIQHFRKLLKRKSEFELQEFDLNDAIARAVRILSPEARKRGIALSTSGVAHSLPVRADPVHLEQVILNLATNGMDAMNQVVPGARTMSIQTASNGRAEVEVSVTDSGTGIPHEKLKDVFATFYTTKQEGTGLGLSIARTIIETYGGKIWAENRGGGGAIFRFTLPLAETGPA